VRGEAKGGRKRKEMSEKEGKRHKVTVSKARKAQGPEMLKKRVCPWRGRAPGKKSQGGSKEKRVGKNRGGKSDDQGTRS